MERLSFKGSFEILYIKTGIGEKLEDEKILLNDERYAASQIGIAIAPFPRAAMGPEL